MNVAHSVGPADDGSGETRSALAKLRGASAADTSTSSDNYVHETFNKGDRL
jgi:hypothetical protein